MDDILMTLKMVYKKQKEVKKLEDLYFVKKRITIFILKLEKRNYFFFLFWLTALQYSADATIDRVMLKKQHLKKD